MRHWALMILVAGAALCGGCQSKAELIVGRWQVYGLTPKEGTEPSPDDTYSLEEKERIIKESNSYFIFGNDSTCAIGGQGMEQTGHYEVLGDTLYYSLAGDQPNFATIIDIDGSDLTLSFNSTRFPQELVHLRKEE